MWLVTMAALTGASTPGRVGARPRARLGGVTARGGVEGGAGGAGADAVAGEAAPAVLERERAGEVLHAALRDAVAEVVRLGNDLVDARDVDHDSRLLVG